MQKKRSKYRIFYDILRNCKYEITKTRLMYASNLNYTLFNKYINELISKGLVSEKNGKYKITQKGLEFLALIDRYEKVKDELSDMQNQL